MNPSTAPIHYALFREMTSLLGAKNVLDRPEDLLLYEFDGSVEKARPDLIVFPHTTEEVSGIVKLAARHEVPVVGRGAGTGLSGGALARGGGVMIVFARMNKILDIDLEGRRAVVQPGVVNLDITRAVEHAGLYFAPDPSSAKSCTIGGNVAENAGGPHTLAYGVTANHIAALQLVLPDGGIVRVGSKNGDAPGYDLCGLFVGSEGTLALVTEITVKLARRPEAVKTLLAIFETIEDACQAVVEITANGITPAACEMLDGWTLRVVEDYVHAGYPRDSGAVLLLEVEGLREAVDGQAAAIELVCKQCHSREVRLAKDDRERDLLWKGRKNAFGALGRVAPSNYVLDGVIPRSKLPLALERIKEIGKKYGFNIGNIFHAGDGNLHPIVLYDPRDAKQFENAINASREVIRACVEMGGALTGEHGVGMEKNELMGLLFSDADFALMRRVHDAFNPDSSLNPGKIFPLSKGCGEIRIRKKEAVGTTL
ncbi:MAG: FAD-linked oxidase C-terminal domain-containing protein [Candidatus Acidiferrum sp.]